MPKKDSESGGVLSANTRGGFRSETMAQFALSALGPATCVEVGDDAGIDLVCATSNRQGKLLHIGPSYFVQVKSDPISEVVFQGENAQQWLEELGSPLLIGCVDKATTRIRLYSTWSVGRVLLQARTDGRTLSKLRLVMEAEVKVDEPDPEAIPLGSPIVDFVLTELADAAKLEKIRASIEAWVQMDTVNILRRRTGIAIAKGYLEWKPNVPPDEATKWYRPYFYSVPHAANARGVIFECATLIALLNIEDEKKALAEYVKRFCAEELDKDDWAKGRLGIE